MRPTRIRDFEMLNLIDLNKKMFKRVSIVVIALTVSVLVNAQEKGDKAIGGNAVLGTGGDYTHFGIGGKFLYNITDPIRLTGEFDFFPKKDYFSWWDFSVYGHYIFPITEKFAVYPLVGLGMMGIQMNVDLGILGKHSDSTNGFVFSPGGGVQFALSSNLALNVELRYKFVNFSDIGVSGNRTHLVAGLAYKF